jgi:hypothetical protein
VINQITINLVTLDLLEYRHDIGTTAAFRAL